MKKYTLRKLGKKLLPVAFGIAAAGATSLASDAHANEVKPDTAPATTETNSEEVKIAVTKETLNNVSTVLESNKKVVADQTTVVENAQNDVTSTKTGVATAQNEVTKLETASKEATAENIEATKTNLASQEKSLADKVSAQDSVSKSLDSKTTEVKTQEAKVTSAQTAVDTENNKVSSANQAVNKAEELLSGSKEAELNKELTDAKVALTNAESKLAEATRKLEEAKKADSDKATALATAKTALDNATSAEKSTKSELDKAQAEHDKALAELNEAKANVTLLENKNPNKLIVPQEFIEAKRKRREDFDNKKPIIEGISPEVERDALNRNVYVKYNNDTTLYDVNNLPLEVRTKLSLFLAELANQYTEQTTGLKNTNKVLKSTIDYAEKVTSSYVKDSYDILDTKNYTFIGNNGSSDTYEPRKNLEGIEKVKQEYGFTNYNPLLKKDIDVTESNMAAKINQTKFTYSELEELVYYAVVDRFFNNYQPKIYSKPIYHVHKLNIQSPDESTDSINNPTTYYHGLDFSSVNGTLALHLLSLNHYSIFESDQNPYEKNPIKNFDKTEVTSSSNPEAVNQAKTKVNELESKVANLKSTTDSAQTKYNSAKSALDKAQAEYNKLVSSNSLTATAQKEFDTASSNKTNAQSRVNNAQSALANLSADAKTKQENLAKAKANLALAQADLAKAKENLETEQAKLDKLNKELSTLKLAVDVAKAETEAVRTKIADTKAYLSTLENAPQLLEKAKADLAKLEAELKVKEETLAKEKATLEEYTNTLKVTERTYQHLLARYNLENPALPELNLNFPTNPAPSQESDVKDTSTNTKEDNTSTKDKNTGTKKPTAGFKVTSSKILPKTSASESNNNSLAGLTALGLLAGYLSTRRKSK